MSHLGFKSRLSIKSTFLQAANGLMKNRIVVFSIPAFTGVLQRARPIPILLADIVSQDKLKGVVSSKRVST